MLDLASILSMRISVSTKLALAGIFGLALLSATHWARGAVHKPVAVLVFLLGVLPNLAAAFAMPLILGSILPKISAEPDARTAKRRYLLLGVFTTLGLCAWEVIQSQSRRFVFDLYDIAATFLGAALAYLAYLWIAGTRSNQSRL